MKFLAWSEDQWFSKEGSLLVYDKLEHFLLAFVGTFITISGLNLHPASVIAVIGVLGILWEVRDGIVVNQNTGVVQGFSWKDLFADIFGIVAGYGLGVYI